MRLLLMRHGEASWQAPFDSARPLSGYGQQQVQQQAENPAIEWQGFAQMLVSPYVRMDRQSLYLRSPESGLPTPDSGLRTPDYRFPSPES